LLLPHLICPHPSLSRVRGAFAGEGIEWLGEGMENHMNRLIPKLLVLIGCFLPGLLQAQHTKPVYVSLPGPGNVQHLAYYVAKEKKFYDEIGLTNVNIVVLRGNAMNVQALLSGSVHYSSAFGPSMHAMFKGEQVRVLLQIFNQIPFGLITRARR
jgi:ABC-type nitrate/sulfonate/bicarbonate transport system substrate-binding protein